MSVNSMTKISAFIELILWISLLILLIISVTLLQPFSALGVAISLNASSNCPFHVTIGTPGNYFNRCLDILSQAWVYSGYPSIHQDIKI